MSWTVSGDTLRLLDGPAIYGNGNFHGATPFLIILSMMYGLGIRLWAKIRKGKTQKRLPGFVISIGNLTAGGTGKTPAVRMLAEWARNEGIETAILSRGYGGTYESRVFVLSDGKRMYGGPDLAGDEPYLLARRLKDVPILISKNRYLAGLTAHERFKSRLFILDDGFQHLTLKRDLDIVLLDASRPLGNGHLLPWGPLREPAKHLQRADMVIFTRSSHGVKENSLWPLSGRDIQEKPQFRADHIPEKVVFPFDNRIMEPRSISGIRVAAFAGIARPDVFKVALTELGAEVVFFEGFRDHHTYTKDEILYLSSAREKAGAEYLITTEKDWVRIEDSLSRLRGLAYLTIRFCLLSGQERLFNIVRERIAHRKEA